MKKIATLVTAAALVATMSLGFTACSNNQQTDSVSVYMPDGAPALAMAQLMVEQPDLGASVSYNVVNANAISSYVSGSTADVCILPVNAAATIAGTGEEYSMLGVVTNGNLYMLSASGEEITDKNLTTLVGKSVGCIQLSSFVGTVLKAVLDANSVPYTVISQTSDAVSDKVNLLNISNPAQEISPSAGYDYMVAAEPVVTAKTSSGALKVVGNLQSLYGENGYPQAVMVAKNSLIESNPDFINALVSAVQANAQWVSSSAVSVESIVTAVTNCGGSQLTSANLKTDTISRCAVSFTPAAQSRAEVLAFMQKYNDVNGTSLSLADKFFYGYTA